MFLNSFQTLTPKNPFHDSTGFWGKLFDCIEKKTICSTNWETNEKLFVTAVVLFGIVVQLVIKPSTWRWGARSIFHNTDCHQAEPESCQFWQCRNYMGGSICLCLSLAAFGSIISLRPSSSIPTTPFCLPWGVGWWVSHSVLAGGTQSCPGTLWYSQPWTGVSQWEGAWDQSLGYPKCLSVHKEGELPHLHSIILPLVPCPVWGDGKIYVARFQFGWFLQLHVLVKKL